jgi:hypothetical protein
MSTVEDIPDENKTFLQKCKKYFWDAVFIACVIVIVVMVILYLIGYFNKHTTGYQVIVQNDQVTAGIQIPMTTSYQIDNKTYTFYWPKQTKQYRDINNTKPDLFLPQCSHLIDHSPAYIPENIPIEAAEYGPYLMDTSVLVKIEQDNITKELLYPQGSTFTLKVDDQLNARYILSLFAEDEELYIKKIKEADPHAVQVSSMINVIANPSNLSIKATIN